MNHYPVFLDLTGRNVLLVGDGPAAEGKEQALLEAGAKIRRVNASDFRPGHLKDVVLVIYATSDEDFNARVSALAAAQRIFCNVVDRPALCSFIAPAVVRKGHVQIAISTGGRSPALAVRLKEEIAKTVGDEYGELLELLASLREQVAARNPTPEARARVFHSMVDSPALDLLRNGRPDEARRLLESLAPRKGSA